jgi:hypothetical protein
MKVYLGPYPNWFGPYQVADMLQYVGVSEPTCFKIGKWLSKTWLGAFAEWFHEKFRQRRVVVKIHKYDTWNIDGTLNPIILPLLKQLRDTQHGSPFVDDADVPEYLRTTAAPPLTEAEKATASPDKLHWARWKWVLNEMIWAFEQLNDPDHEAEFWDRSAPIPETAAEMINQVNSGRVRCDWDGLKAHEARIKRGTTLFGKYYQCLWD